MNGATRLMMRGVAVVSPGESTAVGKKHFEGTSPGVFPRLWAASSIIVRAARIPSGSMPQVIWPSDSKPQYSKVFGPKAEMLTVT